MKEAYNNEGVLVEVPATTPTRNKGGVRYLLTPEETTAKTAQVAIDEAEAPKRIAMGEIQRLEGEITTRRVREAILGTDDGWLAQQEVLIAVQRAKL